LSDNVVAFPKSFSMRIAGNGGSIAITSGKNTAGTSASGSITVVSAASSGSGGSGAVLMQVSYHGCVIRNKFYLFTTNVACSLAMIPAREVLEQLLSLLVNRQRIRQEQSFSASGSPEVEAGTSFQLTEVRCLQMECPPFLLSNDACLCVS